MKKLSIMITCNNDEEKLSGFCNSLFNVLKRISRKYEAKIIFLDNGSSDGTLKTIKEIAKKDPRCNYISVLRKISKDTAMFIGLKNLDADAIFFMDSKHITLLPLMDKMIYSLEKEDFDVCSCKMVNVSPLIYDLVNFTTGIDIEPGELGFKVITKRAAESIVNSIGLSKIQSGMFNWNVFDTKWMECENSDLLDDEKRLSKENLLENIKKTKPLIISTLISIIMIVMSILFICLLIMRRILWQYEICSVVLIISVILLVGGINLLLLSLLIKNLLNKSSLYAHNAPMYVIKDSNTKNIK